MLDKRERRQRTDRRRRNGTKFLLYAVQNGRCFLCLRRLDRSCCRRSVTIDHLVPVIRGGSDRIDNLALCHRDCNQQKRDCLLSPDWICARKRLLGSLANALPDE